MPSQSERQIPGLGVCASVVFDDNDHAPTTLHNGEGLRKVSVFPGPSEDSFSEEGYKALAAAKVDDMVLPLDSTEMQEPLVDEIQIVSIYTLHVALYALQNPTPENIAKALAKIGISGDCEEHIDDTFLPLPVPEPSGWDK